MTSLSLKFSKELPVMLRSLWIDFPNDFMIRMVLVASSSSLTFQSMSRLTWWRSSNVFCRFMHSEMTSELAVFIWILNPWLWKYFLTCAPFTVHMKLFWKILEGLPIFLEKFEIWTWNYLRFRLRTLIFGVLEKEFVIVLFNLCDLWKMGLKSFETKNLASHLTLSWNLIKPRQVNRNILEKQALVKILNPLNQFLQFLDGNGFHFIHFTWMRIEADSSTLDELPTTLVHGFINALKLPRISWNANSSNESTWN